MACATRLALTLDGQDFTVSCHDASAPRTLAALTALLPLPLQLHTPKIAGNHIYWHAPLVADAEAPVDVLATPPGALVYWPVRQMLKIVYAPLQDQPAAVTVLGTLDGPVTPLAELAARLRSQQGRRVFSGTLSVLPGTGLPGTGLPGTGLIGAGLTAPSSGLPGDLPSDLPCDLVADCRTLWHLCPADLLGLTASRALMHPAGPVFVAESECRILHETLWRIRADMAALDEQTTRILAALSLNRTAGRIRDFCQLTGSAGLLFRLEQVLADSMLPLTPALDLSIATAGRLAAWLDLLIPWNDINQAFRAALDSAADAAPDSDADPATDSPAPPTH